MASRGSLNKVLLIGNLTRDPELRYTPSGAAVCTFSIATNRVYTASDGNKKEEVEFHRLVSWNKLAELCSQLLTKGRKVYVEGRLQTRSWTTPAGDARQTTEIVIDDMKLLDRRPTEEPAESTESLPGPEPHANLGEAPQAAGEDQKVDKGKSEVTSKSEGSLDQKEKTASKKTVKGKTEGKDEQGQEPESAEDLIKDLAI